MNKPEPALSPRGEETAPSASAPSDGTPPPGGTASKDNVYDLYETDSLPDYLRSTYTWAYLDPRHVPLLDRDLVVSTILWGNAHRLMNAAFEEFKPGMEVLQPACVYGPFSRQLAETVGAEGYLEVRDIAPVQIAHTRPKIAGLPQAKLVRADAAQPVGRSFDGICCFFLLHEVPDDWKVKIVANLLEAVRPGGKAVFVDYHKPAAWHPLKPIMMGVFKYLEPYARGLWDREIEEIAGPLADQFTWRKITLFGGLYQKVVAERR